MKTVFSGKIILFCLVGIFLVLAVYTATAQTQLPPTTSSAATHIISTVMGDVTVPKDPKRIVVNWFIGDMFALGLKPVAMMSWIQESMPFYDQYIHVPMIKNWEPEGILEYEPDLIITYNKDDFRKLSKIAPVIVVPETMSSIEQLAFLGRVTGREAEASTAISAFEKKRDAAKKVLTADAFTNKTFSIFQDWSNGSSGMYYQTESRGGTLLYHYLRLNKPEKLRQLVESSKKTSDTLSYEVVSDYTGDYILWFLMDNGTSQFAKMEVWHNIPAVQAGHVIEIPAYYNGLFYYSDIASMTAQLDYIVDKLLIATNGH